VSRPPRSSAGSKKVADLELRDTLLLTEDPNENKILELDELCSFVQRKSEKVWVWLALCRESRQVVAFATGERRAAQLASVYGERSPRATRRRVATATSGKPTPGGNPRRAARGHRQGRRRDFSHVERWINTLRQRLSRFVRKTLSFSKSRQMHHCCLKLFIYRYNLERKGTILG
jgi:insertion element IS1 protein InsB